jgi:hypothetical protein
VNGDEWIRLVLTGGTAVMMARLTAISAVQTVDRDGEVEFWVIVDGVQSQICEESYDDLYDLISEDLL